MPSPRLLLTFSLSKRVLPSAGQEAVYGIATGYRRRRDLARKKAVIAQPSQIRTGMRDAIVSQEGYQFLAGKRLFQEAEAIEARQSLLRNLGEDGIHQKPSPPLLALGGKLVVHRFGCLVKRFNQGACSA